MLLSIELIIVRFGEHQLNPRESLASVLNIKTEKNAELATGSGVFLTDIKRDRLLVRM